MSRIIAEESSAIHLSYLRKHGYINPKYSLHSGTLSWRYGFSECKNSINFQVLFDSPDDGSIRLYYTWSNRLTGEKEDLDYRVSLTHTPCHFGGRRYWFVCPLTKNGKYCGNRVGVLYRSGKWYGCRHCTEVAYRAQFESGKYRLGSITAPCVERANEEVKRKYYNGRPTRKYLRYLRMQEKIDSVWIKMARKLGIKL